MSFECKVENFLHVFITGRVPCLSTIRKVKKKSLTFYANSMKRGCCCKSKKIFMNIVRERVAEGNKILLCSTVKLLNPSFSHLFESQSFLCVHWTKSLVNETFSYRVKFSELAKVHVLEVWASRGFFSPPLWELSRVFPCRWNKWRSNLDRLSQSSAIYYYFRLIWLKLNVTWWWNVNLD